ncbi:MAG: 3-deoxy-manno-octulosonate cytidylyltransferase [Gemmatimonadetes bacterium]|nr:3-deoxy-manno-octulosonate cytidylyltransferase [Gemmatimonadota bacterium]MCC6769896.1 3-deoxy-manno-octulosonate cytidylyltransferase [Gemmatimonadaceae bacterium]
MANSAASAPSILAVIPARLGATRLPQKPLRLLGGRPLIVRVWEQVCAMHVAEQVVVATDASAIVDAVESAGGRAVLTSPTHPSGTDRVAEVGRRPEFQRYGVLLNVQGDEPFVSDAAVRGALSMVLSRGFSLGTVAAPAGAEILATSHVVKVVSADDGRALYFSRAPIPYLRDPADTASRDALVRQHVGVYAYTRDALAAWVALPEHPLERVERLEQLRPLAAGVAMGVAVIDAPPAGGVDTEDDLARANARWNDLFAGRS